MARLVAKSVTGQKIGEYHHLAKISDRDVELIIELHTKYKLTYEQIREKFDNVISVSNIAQICRFERRNKLAERWEHE